MRSGGSALVFVAVVAVFARAREPAPSFDVASIKRNVTGDTATSFRWREGGLSVVNFPLQWLISNAYSLGALTTPQRLVGSQTQLLQERFNIEARMPASTPRDRAVMMLRALLADRFRLRMHTETRRLPAFALTIAKPGALGPNLRRTEHNCAAVRHARAVNADAVEPTDGKGRSVCTQTSLLSKPRGAITEFHMGTIDELRQRLQLRVDRLIVNATGLSGNYESELTYAFGYSETDPPPAPELVTALREQLGLKLEPTTAPVEVYVIDSVEMPTPD